MSFHDVREALDVLEGAHKTELTKLRKGVSQHSRSTREVQMKLDEAQKQIKKLARERNEALAKLREREDKLVADRAENHARIATLEAEKEIIALRDREARNELERLSHIKK